MKKFLNYTLRSVALGVLLVAPVGAQVPIVCPTPGVGESCPALRTISWWTDTLAPLGNVGDTQSDYLSGNSVTLNGTLAPGNPDNVFGAFNLLNDGAVVGGSNAG